jgi:hypothetical protein
MLPEKINLKILLSKVEGWRKKFNITALPDWHSEPLWTLDISHIFEFLQKLLKRHSELSEQVDFRKFLDEIVPNAVGWEYCVKELRTEKDLLVRLCSPLGTKN